MQYLYEIRFWLSMILLLTGLILVLTSRDGPGKLWLTLFIATSVAVSSGYYAYSKALNFGWLTYDSIGRKVAEIVLTLFSMAPEILLLVLVLSFRRSGLGIADLQAPAVTLGANPNLSYLKAPPIKPASFTYILILSILGVVLYAAGLLMMVVASENRPDESLVIVGVVLMVGCLVTVVLLTIRCAVYIHRMWRVVQDGAARTTPGKAVGFLFIPLYNLVWVFTAFWGWSKDYNSLRVRHGLADAPQVTEGLFLTVCILTIVGIIPFVNLVVMLPQMIVGLVAMSQICRAINYFAAMQPRASVSDSSL